ncbi:MAG: hypothetical protein HYS41_06530 [Candidatus Omnitrophica bacterium]|nr:hypothetical protein [Candidatus Omnitrophota bacterium]
MKKTSRIALAAWILLAALAGTCFAKKEAPPAPAAQDSPIQALFNTPAPPRLDEPVEVILEVRGRPGTPLPPIREGAKLEILLRLPVGVKLSSAGWVPVEPSAQEKKENPSGIWSLYGWKRPLAKPEGELLDRMPIRLTVAEEGMNWIITARVRVIQGQEAWQTFAATFATLKYGTAKFSPVPLTALDSPKE